MIKYIKFFKNKKIIITGNTGFKGSWLTYILINLGANVYGYSEKLDTKHLNYKLLGLDKKVVTKYGDISDKNKLKKFINKVKPQIIFHLAAQALVKKSYNNPFQTFKTNVEGVLNILEISRDLKNLKCLMIVTSDKCYKNFEKKTGYLETDQLSGEDPYSSSKAAAENIFYSYNKSFYKLKKNIGIVSVRAGNVIGGGDWSEDRIIPDFIKSIMIKKKFVIRSPNSTRPWQHVFDLINGYLILCFKCYGNNRYNGSWNFGPAKKNSITVLKMIQILKKILKTDKNINIKQSKKIKETVNLYLNAKKSEKFLKWKPKFNIFNSLKFTADWYENYINKKDIKKVSLEHFRSFFLSK